MILPRDGVRRDLVARRVSVRRVARLAPSVVRLTLGGPELTGLEAFGPDDHVKLFLPDPETGELVAPRMIEGVLQRPTRGVSISRDYTPRAVRDVHGETELDIDVVLHEESGGAPTGPASAFASKAAPGDELVVAGPRGSRLVPAEVGRVLLVADETGLPAAARWCELLPDDVRATVILDLEDESLDAAVDSPAPGGGASPFARASVERLYRIDGPGQVDEAVRSLGVPEDDEYVWVAGEATTLLPVRRYLVRELGLPRAQVTVDGYWKRGVVNRDHQEPLDPTDPD